MSKNLRERAEITAEEVQDILGVSPGDHSKEVADAVEHAIIRALIEERERCATIAQQCHEGDAQKAERVADEIRKVRSVLISNLSAMR